jgi:hypothetical protein
VSPERWPVGLVAWDELFIGFNDVSWGPSAGYDQNRLFLGVARPVDDWGRVEVGYLLAHLDREPDLVAHAVAVNLFVNARPRAE